MATIQRDSQGNPIPQYLNSSTGLYEANTGSDGAFDANIKTMPDGTDATGVTQLTGGTGIRGWLSGIFSKLSGILTTKIDQTTDGTTNRVVAKISQTAGENVVALAAGTNNIGDVDVLTLPPLPSGSAIIGKTGIDQTTDGSTNRVVAKISQTAGENTVVLGTGSSTIGNVGGVAAHGSSVSGNPVRLGGRALTSNYTAVTSGQTADLVTTTVGALVTKQYSIPEADWQYTTSTTAITNTSAVALKAAGASGIRNYLTGLSYQNSSATATLVEVLDGATVIAIFNAPASMTVPAMVQFPTPLKGTVATALNFACVTTGANVYVNAQGYQAP